MPCSSPRFRQDSNAEAGLEPANRYRPRYCVFAVSFLHRSPRDFLAHGSAGCRGRGPRSRQCRAGYVVEEAGDSTGPNRGWKGRLVVERFVAIWLLLSGAAAGHDALRCTGFSLGW